MRACRARVARRTSHEASRRAHARDHTHTPLSLPAVSFSECDDHEGPGLRIFWLFVPNSFAPDLTVHRAACTWARQSHVVSDRSATQSIATTVPTFRSGAADGLVHAENFSAQMLTVFAKTLPVLAIALCGRSLLGAGCRSAYHLPPTYAPLLPSRARRAVRRGGRLRSATVSRSFDSPRDPCESTASFCRQEGSNLSALRT